MLSELLMYYMYYSINKNFHYVIQHIFTKVSIFNIKILNMLINISWNSSQCTFMSFQLVQVKYKLFLITDSGLTRRKSLQMLEFDFFYYFARLSSSLSQFTCCHFKTGCFNLNYWTWKNKPQSNDFLVLYSVD